MKKFFRLNSKYIFNFRKNISSKFESYDKRSISNFLKTILKELTSLFNKIGGQRSSKYDIPNKNDYPESKKINKLVDDICFDLDKLYTSQSIIVEDLNSLLQLNDYHRDQIFNSFILMEHKINKEYIKSLSNDSSSNIIIECFDSEVIFADGSQNISIDSHRKVLSLESDYTVHRPIDTNMVNIEFINYDSSFILYPNSKELNIGSNWKKELPDDSHFIKSNNHKVYRNKMLNITGSNEDIGYCEFESVFSYDNDITNLVNNIKDYVGNHYKKNPNTLYLTSTSLQPDYIDNSKVLPDFFNKKQILKLSIPLTVGDIYTNQFNIDFSYMSNGNNPPIIIPDKSYVYGNDNLSYPITSAAHAGDGKYACIISSFVNLKQIDLMLDIGTAVNSWSYIDWAMSYWEYNQTINYIISKGKDENDKDFNISLTKTYDIFVDTKSDLNEEKNNAAAIINNNIGVK